MGLSLLPQRDGGVIALPRRGSHIPGFFVIFKIFKVYERFSVDFSVDL